MLVQLTFVTIPAGAQGRNDNYIQMTSGDLARQYILVTPRAANNGPLPLIVVLHGTVGTGEKMQRALGFDQHVNHYGFAVAYPDAYTLPGERKTTRWNDGRDTLASTKLGVDDVQFLRDMVTDISRRVDIDRRRIFVTGASNGGMMAYRAACEAADLFAATAPVIGNIPVPISQTCKSGPGISILAINGTQDPFVPFTGGLVCSGIGRRFCEQGYVISAQDSLRTFASRAGCQGPISQQMLPATYKDDPPVRQVSYSNCQGNRRVTALWIQGGGHNWPPLSGQLGGRNGSPTRNLDATKVMIEFFLNLSR